MILRFRVLRLNTSCTCHKFAEFSELLKKDLRAFSFDSFGNYTLRSNANFVGLTGLPVSINISETSIFCSLEGMQIAFVLA